MYGELSALATLVSLQRVTLSGMTCDVNELLNLLIITARVVNNFEIVVETDLLHTKVLYVYGLLDKNKIVIKDLIVLHLLISFVVLGAK